MLFTHSNCGVVDWMGFIGPGEKTALIITLITTAIFSSLGYLHILNHLKLQTTL